MISWESPVLYRFCALSAVIRTAKAPVYHPTFPFALDPGARPGSPTIPGVILSKVGKLSGEYSATVSTGEGTPGTTGHIPLPDWVYATTFTEPTRTRLAGLQHRGKQVYQVR